MAEESEPTQKDLNDFPSLEKSLFDDPNPVPQPVPEAAPIGPGRLAISEPLLDLPEEAPAPTPLDAVKQFSETLDTVQEPIAASYPFTLLIEGKLADQERERLTHLLETEDFGIRLIDIEAQLTEGRVLLPRVSEYAAVLVAQALHGCDAKLTLYPSDANEVRTSRPVFQPDPDLDLEAEKSTAGRIPILVEPAPADSFVTIGRVYATVFLKAQTVEATDSEEFGQALENVRTELQHKAYRRGADAVADFRFDLIPLRISSHYRMIASGNAIKSKSQT